MTGKVPSFFSEIIEAMLNLCLTVYIYISSENITFTYFRNALISLQADIFKIYLYNPIN